MNEVKSAAATSQAGETDKTLAPGAEKLLGVVGAFLIAVGFFSPDAQAQTSSFFGPSAEISFNLTQAGLAGIFIVVIGVALGLAPFYLQKRRRTNLIAFGLACAIFGALAIAWVAALSLPAMISAIGHLAIGFYALLVGYGLNVFIMSKRVLAD